MVDKMSKLPLALLERLKKRGIIKEDETADCPVQAKKKTTIEEKLFDAPGCPHKTSLTHFCNRFCVQKFGKGIEKPASEVQRLYEKLVRKYPMTEEWVEVWEAGV